MRFNELMFLIAFTGLVLTAGEDQPDTNCKLAYSCETGHKYIFYGKQHGKISLSLDCRRTGNKSDNTLELLSPENLSVVNCPAQISVKYSPYKPENESVPIKSFFDTVPLNSSLTLRVHSGFLSDEKPSWESLTNDGIIIYYKAGQNDTPDQIGEVISDFFKQLIV